MSQVDCFPILIGGGGGGVSVYRSIGVSEYRSVSLEKHWLTWLGILGNVEEIGKNFGVRSKKMDLMTSVVTNSFTLHINRSFQDDTVKNSKLFTALIREML